MGGFRPVPTRETFSEPVLKTAPLNVLDELYLNLDRRDEPWSVPLEIRVEGRIDAARLRDAVRRAALVHPMARARLAHARATDVRYRWEIAAELASVDLEEVNCRRSGDLAAARERLLSRMPDLDLPGPFCLLLAHERRGDALVMNLHHAAGDALGVRDVSAIAGSASLRERVTRGRAAIDYLTRGVSTPTRLAPQAPSDRPRYGVELG